MISLANPSLIPWSVRHTRYDSEKTKRSVEVNLKQQGKKSKALKELYLQEKDEFAQEASKPSSTFDALYPKNPSDSPEGSYKSLESDDSGVSISFNRRKQNYSRGGLV